MVSSAYTQDFSFKKELKKNHKITYQLFSNKKTSYRLMLDSNASVSERWAALELQHWLKEISGAYFPIDSINTPYKGPQIIIGFNERVKLLTSLKAPDEVDESFRYFNDGKDIYIYGGKLRGTMYGVTAFLENEFGCRWYTPTVSVIPKMNHYRFSVYQFSDSPKIRIRHNNYWGASDPVWAARNKMNGRQQYVDQPGGVQAYWGVHTFYQLLPPAEFFDKHPEYYSLVKGKRIYFANTKHEPGQLCLSNEDVVRIVTERVKERMRKNPEYLVYDVSHNDIWGNHCECNKCLSKSAEYGGESGLMIWFVNQIAAEVKNEFPNKFIGTLAYRYTRNPPVNISPHKNVVIRLCPIEACVAHDLASCPQNQSFMKDLKGWSSIAPHLFIWDYVTNFEAYILPYPNFNVLKSNIQTFQKYNSIGIMEQGNYQSPGGEFAELRTYLLSRLLWDPDSDVDSIVNDFTSNYYGKSSQYILQYFKFLHSQITAESHIHIGLKAQDSIFSIEFINQSLVIFEKAKKVANDDEILSRVQLASLPVLYLKCKRFPRLAFNDGTYMKFRKIVKQHGITKYSESGETADSFDSFVKGGHN
ncbi:DUF4838 domain-containing protein [Pedobacter immunditicola]|uniref:DUF4838 domain-containing protein n=1 Tax=Pedobacter immunditicola TaxID=3133440 RepID=UPI0030A15921